MLSMDNIKKISFTKPQIDVFNDKSYILIVDGPAGNGKSTIIREKLHAYLKRYPKSNALLVRKSLESTKNSVVVTYINEICQREPDTVWYNEDDSRFEYSNGSYLFIAGVKNEAQRKALKGIGSGGSIHIVVVEEAAELFEYDMDEILSRCRGDSPAGWRQLILTCNPEGEDHWINTRYILPLEKEENLGKGYIYQKNDNVSRITWAQEKEFCPAIDEKFIESQNSLSGVMYLRNRLGKWVSATGAVYADFKRALHVIPSFEIPDYYERYRSIDFGGSDAANVCIWGAKDPFTNKLYIYKYIYRLDLTPQEFAEVINDVNGTDKTLYTVSDHQAGERRTLSKMGIPTIAADKDIKHGIKLLQNRLRPPDPKLLIFEDALNNGKDENGQEIVDIDPKLRGKRRSKNGLEEFSSYIWAKKSDGQITDVPVDRDNDFLDCARYLVTAIDQQMAGVSVITQEDIEEYKQRVLDDKDNNHNGIMVF